MRASDADRERVAKILHDAMAEGRLTVPELEKRLDVVYSAKTFAELEPITRDLPVAAQPLMPGSRPVGPATDRIGGIGGPAHSIAVMSGVHRKGAWVVPEHHGVVAVMGGVKLDLTEARFAAAETTIQVFTFWGGVEIRVPAEVIVHVQGHGFMGAFDDKTTHTAPPGSPVVHITGLAVMAGVEVKPRAGRS